MPISGFHSKWLSWQRWQIRKTFRRSAAAATLVLLQSLQSFKDGGQPQTVVLRVVKEGHTDGGSHAPRRVRISCSLVPCHPCFALANTYIATNTTKSLREINKRKKETTQVCVTRRLSFRSFPSACVQHLLQLCLERVFLPSWYAKIGAVALQKPCSSAFRSSFAFVEAGKIKREEKNILSHFSCISFKMQMVSASSPVPLVSYVLPMWMQVATRLKKAPS